MSKISIFLLVSVAEQTGLNLILLETPEDMFSGVQAHMGLRHEKTCLRGFWPGLVQTCQLSFRDLLELWNYVWSKIRYHTLQEVNNKALTTVWMCRQVCTFVVGMQQCQVFLRHSPYIVYSVNNRTDRPDQTIYSDNPASEGAVWSLGLHLFGILWQHFGLLGLVRIKKLELNNPNLELFSSFSKNFVSLG